MITSLPSYPKMKNSGVPWLGEVPEHWEVLPNRAVFSEINEREHADEQMLSVTITKGVICQQALLEDSSKKDSSRLDKSAYKLVCPGDIAYNKMRAWQGAIGVSEYQGIVSPAYVVQRPRAGNNARYLHYLLRTPAFAKEAERWSYGITSDMWSLRPEHFKMIYTCVPPPEEQAAIVRYLDGVDRKIRRFIRNRRRLIEVLNAQKQAIINQVVTGKVEVRKVEGKREKGEENRGQGAEDREQGDGGRGQGAGDREQEDGAFYLVPRPAQLMKPSGVEWLGDIPKGWEVSKLSSRYDQCLGKMVDAKRFTGTCSIPYLRNIDVQWDQVNSTDLPVIDIGLYERERFTVQPGDLLVCEGGEVGRCAFWNGQLEVCGFQKALHRLRPLNPKSNYPRFLYYCMFNASKLGVFVADGSENTIAHLTGVKLRAHRFAFAPFDEQRNIADYLDNKTKEIEKTVKIVQREIDLIREYRTRLITDVVTGNADVRKAEVGRMKDEEEEREKVEGKRAKGEEEEMEEALEEAEGLLEDFEEDMAEEDA